MESCITNPQTRGGVCLATTTLIFPQLQVKKRSLRVMWRLADIRYQLLPRKEKNCKGAEQTNIRTIYTHNSYKTKGSPQQRRYQQRALVFRTRQETTRVTKLLDAHGNKQVIRQHGKMGLTKHVNILAALEMRALRYHNKGH